MDVKKSIQRLGWRFSEASKKNNTFKINQNDLDALNSIAEYVEQTQAQQFKDNESFAKLYILAYAKMINHYKTDIFDSKPRKMLIQTIERDFEAIITDFQEQVNDLHISSALSSLGVKLEHPSLIDEKEKDRRLKVLQENMKDENFKSDYLNGHFDIDTVRDCLTSEVNHALNILR